MYKAAKLPELWIVMYDNVDCIPHDEHTEAVFTEQFPAIHESYASAARAIQEHAHVDQQRYYFPQRYTPVENVVEVKVTAPIYEMPIIDHCIGAPICRLRSADAAMGDNWVVFILERLYGAAWLQVANTTPQTRGVYTHEDLTEIAKFLTCIARDNGELS